MGSQRRKCGLNCSQMHYHTHTLTHAHTHPHTHTCAHTHMLTVNHMTQLQRARCLQNLYRTAKRDYGQLFGDRHQSIPNGPTPRHPNQGSQAAPGLHQHFTRTAPFILNPAGHCSRHKCWTRVLLLLPRTEHGDLFLHILIDILTLLPHHAPKQE